MEAFKVFLTFFTIFFFCTADQDIPGAIDECPEVQSADNFNSNSFFRGRWNVVKFYGWMPKGNNSCTRIEFLPTEKSNEVEMNFFSYNNGKIINNTFSWIIKNSGEITYDGNHDYQTDSGTQTLKYHAKVNSLIIFYLNIFLELLFRLQLLSMIIILQSSLDVQRMHKLKENFIKI